MPVSLLTPAPPEPLPDTLRAPLLKLAAAGMALATTRAYRSDLALITAWCARYGLSARPAAPEAVAGFLAAEAARGRKASTPELCSAAIRYAYLLFVVGDPASVAAVKRLMEGIRRTIGTTRWQKRSRDQ